MSAAVSPVPPAAPDAVLELIHAFRRSKTMFTAVSLEIFEGKRPSGVEVPRLLDACVSLGLLEKRGRDYFNTSIADTYLRRASPWSLTGYIRYSDVALFRLWANLENAILSGSNQWTETFGESGRAMRDSIAVSEEFMRGMHGIGMITSPAVVEAFDLSSYRCLLDLGGATGHFAVAARRRYPGLRAIVFDLPSVVQMAAKEARDGIEFIAGDFCTDPLPPADLIALGRILHHRSEQLIVELLSRAYERLPAGGGVLVIERIVDNASGGSVDAHLHSLNMLVCTDGGRERTFEEYEALLEQAGFGDIRVCVTGTSLDVVMATKQGGDTEKQAH